MSGTTILKNASIHTLSDARPNGTPDAEALAIEDGVIRAVGEVGDLDRFVDDEAETIDLGGRPLLPGFIDAHTHLEKTGQYLLHADLSTVGSREGALEALREQADTATDWILGFGYDRTQWDDDRPLTKDDLDPISDATPIAAFHVDTHSAVVNSVALELFDERTDAWFETEHGEPTGVIVEDGVNALEAIIGQDIDEIREIILAAQDHAVSLGITTVHEMVRDSLAPRVYRQLDTQGELKLRVRINYWSDHLDAVIETGLHRDHGSEFVCTGGIKSYTDGAPDGRTAKLFEPYADGEGRGEWVVPPEELREIVSLADEHDHQMIVHAIGDEAIEETLNALETTSSPETSRHRIEHCQLATDEHIERLQAIDVIASIQPNILRWTHADEMLEQRLGEKRARESKRIRTLLDADVQVAFSSDCIPIGPLYGIHHAVNARDPAQRVSVGEALRAYTYGSAYAGFAEQKRGTISPGKQADLVVLEESPWERPDSIKDIDVDLTMVDGEIVYQRE